MSTTYFHSMPTTNREIKENVVWNVNTNSHKKQIHFYHTHFAMRNKLFFKLVFESQINILWLEIHKIHFINPDIFTYLYLIGCISFYCSEIVFLFSICLWEIFDIFSRFNFSRFLCGSNRYLGFLINSIFCFGQLDMDSTVFLVKDNVYVLPVDVSFFCCYFEINSFELVVELQQRIRVWLIDAFRKQVFCCGGQFEWIFQKKKLLLTLLR